MAAQNTSPVNASQLSITRRSFVAAVPALGVGALAYSAGAAMLVPRAAAHGATTAQPAQDALAEAAQPAAETLVHAEYPAQDPALVREIVGASHGNVARVKELVAAHPALAKANWDWGFGDHETALGAASHVGNREIALFLLEHGAAPTLFSATMLGQLAVVQAMCEASSGIQRTPGPHGITLLSHARAGREPAAPVLEYLTSLGGADERATNLPQTDDERARCVGTYRFGPGERDELVVKADRGTLWLSRGGPGATQRGLSHGGNFEYTPAGAPAVRVRFEGGVAADVNGGAFEAVVVADGPRVVRGVRVA